MGKACTVCKVEKDLTEFRRNAKAADGHSSRCEQCVLDHLVDVRAARREKAQAGLKDAGGKVCTRCRQFKPTEKFAARSNTVDGLQSHCQDCDRERFADARKADPVRFADKARAAYDANPEKFRNRTREWCANNRAKANAAATRSNRVTRWHVALASQCRRLSVKKGLPACNFDGAYLLALFNAQGGRCYWLGIALVPSVEHRAPRRPSVDRLDNAAGYVRGNVVIASQFANMGRSSLDADTFARFVGELRREMRATKT